MPTITQGLIGRRTTTTTTTTTTTPASPSSSSIVCTLSVGVNTDGRGLRRLPIRAGVVAVAVIVVVIIIYTERLEEVNVDLDNGGCPIPTIRSMM